MQSQLAERGTMALSRITMMLILSQRAKRRRMTRKREGKEKEMPVRGQVITWTTNISIRLGRTHRGHSSFSSLDPPLKDSNLLSLLLMDSDLAPTTQLLTREKKGIDISSKQAQPLSWA